MPCQSITMKETSWRPKHLREEVQTTALHWILFMHLTFQIYTDELRELRLPTVTVSMCVTTFLSRASMQLALAFT